VNRKLGFLLPMPWSITHRILCVVQRWHELVEVEGLASLNRLIFGKAVVVIILASLERDSSEMLLAMSQLMAWTVTSDLLSWVCTLACSLLREV
jgi:hypothetical protein